MLLLINSFFRDNYDEKLLQPSKLFLESTPVRCHGDPVLHSSEGVEDAVDEFGDVTNADVAVTVHVGGGMFGNNRISVQQHINQVGDVANADLAVAIHISVHDILDNELKEITPPRVGLIGLNGSNGHMEHTAGKIVTVFTIFVKNV